MSARGTGSPSILQSVADNQLFRLPIQHPVAPLRHADTGVGAFQIRLGDLDQNAVIERCNCRRVVHQNLLTLDQCFRLAVRMCVVRDCCQSATAKRLDYLVRNVANAVVEIESEGRPCLSAAVVAIPVHVGEYEGVDAFGIGLHELWAEPVDDRAHIDVADRAKAPVLLHSEIRDGPGHVVQRRHHRLVFPL